MSRPNARVAKDAVFVDRYGRRRLLVIGAGVLMALALTGWLALMVVSIVAVAVADVPPPPG